MKKKKPPRKGTEELRQECLDAIDSALSHTLLVRGRARKLFVAWRSIVEEDAGPLIELLGKKLKEE